MPHELHDESLSDRDRLAAMLLAVSEIQDTVFRTQTLIDQTQTMLHELDIYGADEARKDARAGRTTAV